MPLPDNFTFSQSSLQDYLDCPRRFYLRHVQRLAWPALTAEPPLDNERFMKQGAAFHRLVQQHLLGVPAPRLASMLADRELQSWWENYLQAQQDPQGGLPQGLAAELSGPGKRISTEITLSAPLGQYRLVGKFDALAISAAEHGRRAKIFEWKTNQQRPKPAQLASRIQTRAYLYLLVKAGACLNEGENLAPEQVEMIYWFARFPAQAQRFEYDTRQYTEDGEYLEGLVARVAASTEADFPLTRDEKNCRYCIYRSLCERGLRAGSLEDELSDLEVQASLAGEAPGIDFSFEQIGEISF
jgi:CRISPR/Cas system-associated exonuclease Cas4 (RecB family)